jgi:hypothetical protein
MASVAGTSRSSDSSTRVASRPRFVVCVSPGSNHDLQARRIYQVLPDVSAARSNFIRVLDDSGEDYLYPSRLFLPLQVSSAIREALRSPVAASV